MRNHTLKIKIPYSLHKEGISMKKAIFPILLCICALLCSCGNPTINTTSGRTTDAGMTTQSDTGSGTPTGTTGTMQTTDLPQAQHRRQPPTPPSLPHCARFMQDLISAQKAAPQIIILPRMNQLSSASPMIKRRFPLNLPRIP